MSLEGTRRRVGEHLRFLVEMVGARPPGSPSNAAATDHVRNVLASAGLPVLDLPFRTVWWEPGQGRLTAGGVEVDVAPNPYSPRATSGRPRCGPGAGPT